MSEELEWELFDIFESGLFVFPLYEHNSARKVIRYLLMRGILDEEIAEAIEDSTIDLHLWLNRCPGKYMVGEWVIAWMNDCREEYERERGDDLSDFFDHYRSREMTPLSATTTTDEPGELEDDVDEDRRSASRMTDFESISSHAEVPSARPYMAGASDVLASPGTPVAADNSPPPLPPRTLMFTRIRSANGEFPKERPPHRPSQLELLHDSLAVCDSFYDEPPDSGNVSDIYASIPTPKILTRLVKDHEDNCALHRRNKTVDTTSDLPVCQNCNCTFTHYSYSQKSRNAPYDKDDSVKCFLDNQAYSDPYYKGPMEYTYDTIDKDGPGFIFIITDSSHSSLSWSVEHSYKIASSRQPDRWMTENSTARNGMELIWKVKVRHHSQAASEIHQKLEVYSSSSNDWYKCSLSLIMDAISKTVRQYKL